MSILFIFNRVTVLSFSLNEVSVHQIICVPERNGAVRPHELAALLRGSSGFGCCGPQGGHGQLIVSKEIARKLELGPS